MQSLKDSAEAKIVLSLLTPHICNNLEAKVQNIFIKKIFSDGFFLSAIKSRSTCKLQTLASKKRQISLIVKEKITSFVMKKKKRAKGKS